jgi:hypothetical protein
MSSHERSLKRHRSEVAPSDSTEITLRSDEHAHALLNRLNRQRESGTLCDVRLRVEDEEFSAHRSVLAASSDFLHALLVGGWKESSENVIRLDGVDAKSFRALLSFIYSGELHAQDIDDLFQLLVSAEHLGITSARPICVERLQERLDLPNALRMRLLAQQVPLQLNIHRCIMTRDNIFMTQIAIARTQIGCAELEAAASDVVWGQFNQVLSPYPVPCT